MQIPNFAVGETVGAMTPDLSIVLPKTVITGSMFLPTGTTTVICPKGCCRVHIPPVKADTWIYQLADGPRNAWWPEPLIRKHAPDDYRDDERDTERPREVAA